MPLNVTLAPGESILIGKARVANPGSRRLTLVLHGSERVLRQKYIMQRATATTPSARFYYAVLLNYLSGLTDDVRDALVSAAADIIAITPDAKDEVATIGTLIAAGEDYEAVVRAWPLAGHLPPPQEGAT